MAKRVRPQRNTVIEGGAGNSERWTASLGDGVSTAEIGRKAFALARLIAHGVRVPEGYAVTTAACARFFAGGGKEFPPEVAQDILARHSAMGLDRVAVRSSGVAEDLADASYAGQYETVLDVTPDRLLEAIAQCWRSARAQHVKTYAERHGGDGTDGMGVIIQRMVPADAAGVSFSRNPVDGSDQVVINCAWGLGEAVVSGLVTPDMFLVDRVTRAVTALPAAKECWIRPAPAGGTVLEEIPTDLSERPSLDPAEVMAVAETTWAIEQAWGTPIDVEFAFLRGVLYVLQARPITA